MSPESTETLSDGAFELQPPQTVEEATGIVVDDVRAVDASYGGLLARDEASMLAKEPGKDEGVATQSSWALSNEAANRRERAVAWAVDIRPSQGASVAMLISDAKAIEAYLAGE